MNTIVTIAGFEFSLGAIIATVVPLGCLAGMAYMFATAPLVDADERPADETQDDPRLVDAMREMGK